ncbi:hypothetical protein Tco_1139062, partial [Tanacetum coccineum]
APPPRHRTSTERDNGDIGFSDHKHMSAHEMSNNFKMDDDQKRKSTKDETVILVVVHLMSGNEKAWIHWEKAPIAS